MKLSLTFLFSLTRKAILALMLPLLLLSFVFLTGSYTAHADDSTAGPLVYVQKVTLDKQAYSSGDTVTGTFVLANQRNTNVSNVIYRISLTGDYQANGLPKTTYDSVTVSNDPVFLSASQQQTVSFSYALPQGVAGKHLGIQIQAMLATGQPMAWANAFLDITGSSDFAQVTGSGLEVNNLAYALQAGPTVYSGQSAFLNANLSNQTSKTLTLTPELSFYNMTVTGNPIATSSASAVKIASKKTADVHIALPLFDGIAGVYAGKIDFVDASNTPQAQSLEFRYIIPGPIVTLRSISSDEEYVFKNSSISVAVNYTGTPYDAAIGTLGTSSPANTPNTGDLNIQLFNQQGILVGNATSTIDFNKSTSYTFNLKALTDADSLKAVATVLQNGKITTTLGSTLSGSDSASLAAQAQHEIQVRNRILLIGLTVFILAIIILLIILIKRIRDNKKSHLVYIFLGAMLVSSLVIGHRVLANYVQTSQTTNFNTTPIDQSDITINPLNSQTGTDEFSNAQGQTFYVTGSVTAGACTNGLDKVKVYASAPYLSSSYATSTSYAYTLTDNNNPESCDNNPNCTNNGNGEYSYDVQSAFSLGSIPVPTTPGHYIINFQIKNILNRTDDQYYANNTASRCDVDDFKAATAYPSNDGGAAAAHQCPVNYLNNVNTGYITFTVSPSGGISNAVVNLYGNGSQNEIDTTSGSTINLTWSTSNIASSTCSTYSGAWPTQGSLADNNTSPGVTTNPINSNTTFQMECQDTNGNIVYSNQVPVVVNSSALDTPQPTPILSCGSQENTVDVDITWPTITDATDYYVYEDGNTTPVADVFNTGYEINNVSQNSTDYYTVAAHNANTTSAQSTKVYLNNSSSSWNPSSNEPSANWTGITFTSSDGSDVEAVTSSNGGYFSTDGGSTWSQDYSVPTSPSWQALASSENGSTMAAVDSNNGYIYISKNDGGFLAQTSAGAHNWQSVAVSADGSTIVAAYNGDNSSNDGYIYVSTTTATWVQINPNSPNLHQPWQAVAVSPDGTTMAAVAYGGGIYYSTDGMNWTQAKDNNGNYMAENWTSITAANGNIMAAVAYGGEIYYSADGGETWTASNAATGNWDAVSSSADGSKMAAADNGSYIYFSTDKGKTWTSSGTATGSWQAVAVSYDGSKIVGAQ